jgi:hypothetical protein
MGHRNIATTQKYTHLRPMHEIPAHERLADAMPISDLVMVRRRHARPVRVSGKVSGLLSTRMKKHREKRGHLAKLSKDEQRSK